MKKYEGPAFFFASGSKTEKPCTALLRPYRSITDVLPSHVPPSSQPVNCPSVCMPRYEEGSVTSPKPPSLIYYTNVCFSEE
ncbi:hypothetical protein EVAR_61764_1 [Eumeta japonica]|uniref:Uncharacterized protein n=1 Tax=Eumeta variegata TaxID=151549 RepID=A0A4C1ZFW1_EUMVA|nr:hypothetical protein EVAR_61764_1 [Eumeta japonica]